MGYGLGVDLGTSFTGVAIGRHARTQIVPLSDDPISASALAAVRPAGGLVLRETDDTVPVTLGGRPYPPVAVLAAALRSVLEAVTASEGEAPDQVVLTCPAVWGPSRRQQFGEVSRRAGLATVTVVSEPEAAVTAMVDGRRLAEDDVVLVYDLGGVTADLTVVRVSDSGMEILGLPEGVDGIGGVDFDDLILAYVDRAVGGALSDLDLSDPVAVGVLTGVRAECVRAKEALSRIEMATIRVVGLGQEVDPVRLTRPEFEAMIRGPLKSTLTGIRRVLDSAGVKAADLTAVVLVGGSSRIPLVARMLAKNVGRPVLVDEHPQHCVALGAAAIADGASTIIGGGLRITPGAPPITDGLPTIAAALAMAAAAAGPPPSPTGAIEVPPIEVPSIAVPPVVTPPFARPPAVPPTHTPTHPLAIEPGIEASAPGGAAALPPEPPVDSDGTAETSFQQAFPPGTRRPAAGRSRPVLSRRAGGHRMPLPADWRRPLWAERYAGPGRPGQVLAVIVLTAALIAGATYLLSPFFGGDETESASHYPPPITASSEPSDAATAAPTGSPSAAETSTPAATTTSAKPSPTRKTPTRTATPTKAPAGRTGTVVGLDGQCLDSPSRAGDEVQIFECNGTSAQRWTVTGGTLQARGKCLQIVDVGAEDPRLKLNRCDDGDDQEWVVSSGVVVNPGSAECLDVLNTNPKNRTPVIMTDCGGGPGQIWRLRT